MDPMHQDSKARLIAFYLPQFHPIPENDDWWGKGFTEWTNVRAAKPSFSGHHQPRVPGALGYYDLRDPVTREAQARLASEHGIQGFCYYHYWFNGKQLLEQPFTEVLSSGKPDFPFCLCWANENWTRAWDGLDREILIAQDYASYDVDQHVDSLSPAFKDPRYIRVNGSPLFLIYRVDQIPELARVLSRFRQRAAYNGIKRLYICAVRNTQYSLTPDQTINSGIDALVDFQPNSKQLEFYEFSMLDHLKKLWGKCLKIAGHSSASAFLRLDYERFVSAVIKSSSSTEHVHPCVFPAWDNSARRATGATIIQNDEPAVFGRFLRHAIGNVSGQSAEERLVFINAWNEWAEGCYLEPDQKNGLAFLEEIRRTVDQ